MSSCRVKARPFSSTSDTTGPGPISAEGRTMKPTCTILGAAMIVMALFPAARASAEEPLKVGLVAEFSGPFAGYGKQIHNGIKAYMKQHGDTVAGRKVEIILKDTTGPSPETAKRLAQDLVTQDKVDFLAGFGLTPNPLAVAPLATQAKTPMTVMNAASAT